MTDKRRMHRKAFVINRIPLSCEYSDVEHEQRVDPWGQTDSESLIREGVSKHDYVP